MIRATKVIRAGHWSGPAADAVLLAHEDRHRRRLAMQGEGGLEFLLDLPEATRLHHGDGLALEDGRIVEVHAKPEPLLEVTRTRSASSGAARLASRQPPRPRRH